MDFQTFSSKIQPWMLDSSGRFLGPQSGVNYAFEGMTPQQVYDATVQRYNVVQANKADNDNHGFGNYEGTLETALDPTWRPGPIDTKRGFLGNWGVPLAMLAMAYGGGALLGGAGGGATAGGVAGGTAGGVGATEGALGLASTSPVVGGTAGVTATDLGALGGAGGAAGGGYGALGSGTYGLGGSLTTGAYPGSVLAADSVIAPTTMDTIMSGAGVGAGTLGGATDATGALIGNGTAAAGAASMTVPASGGGFGSGLVDWLKENPMLTKIGMGLIGAKASGNTTTSASKDPWAPAQPYLLQNLAQNQAMSNQYNANPFSNEQKAAYQGLLNTVANSQAAGNGLLGMASNFGKSSRGVIPQSAALPTGVTAPQIDWSQYANFGGKR